MCDVENCFSEHIKLSVIIIITVGGESSSQPNLGEFGRSVFRTRRVL